MPKTKSIAFFARGNVFAENIREICGNKMFQCLVLWAIFIIYMYNKERRPATQVFMEHTNKNIVRIRLILKKEYPQAHIALHYGSTWELLVAVILSAQCTDVRVNIVTKSLFQKYKTIESYSAANRKEFEKDIHSTGFYKNKAKHIIEAATMIIHTFGGVIPDTMEQLTTLPGVARKTANVILYNAFHKNEGIAVDTHVLRLSKRLHLVPPADWDNPVKTERSLQQIVPQREWGEITYQLIDHGRSVCQAKKPLCATCVLRTYCPSAQ